MSARSNIVAFAAAVATAGAAFGIASNMSSPVARSAAYGQIGSPSSPRCQVVTATDTTVTFARSHLSAIPACFPLGDKLVVQAFGGVAHVVASLSVDVTYQDDIAENDGFYLRDANGADGQAGWGVPLADGETKYLVLDPQHLTGPGYRTGVCSAQVLTPAQTWRYPACRVDGDCTTLAGSGTCDTASDSGARARTILNQGCAVLRVQVGTANTRVCVTGDR